MGEQAHVSIQELVHLLFYKNNQFMSVSSAF